MTWTRVLALGVTALLATGCAGRLASLGSAGQPFNVVETGIPELQRALADGRVTSRQLTVEYLTRMSQGEALRGIEQGLAWTRDQLVTRQSPKFRLVGFALDRIAT